MGFFICSGIALLARRQLDREPNLVTNDCIQPDAIPLTILEEAVYPLDGLIYELANLDAGFRFSRDESRWGGRLAIACQQRYGNQSFPGYLENGLPLKYGAGAEVIVAAVHKDPQAKQAWINEFLGAGDIDRVIIEWRSLLRQIAHAPRMDWDRWTSLQQLAREVLKETDSPTCQRSTIPRPNASTTASACGDIEQGSSRVRQLHPERLTVSGRREARNRFQHHRTLSNLQVNLKGFQLGRHHG